MSDSPPRRPRALAIIVNWNKKPFLDRLLSDLEKLERPPDHILVVDNDSTDGSVEMVRNNHPTIQLLCTGKNLGGSGGFNAGLRWGLEHGGFDYFWLLDNDVVIHPGALSGLLDVAESDPEVGLVGSRIAVLGQPDRTQEVGAMIEWPICSLIKVEAEKIALPTDFTSPRIHQVEYAASCSLLARVAAIEEVGIWDSTYFIFFDDIEWGVRFNKAGWKVKATTASTVEHESFHDRRFSQTLGMRYLALRNGIYFFWAFTPSQHRIRAIFYMFRRIVQDIIHFHREGRGEIARSLRVALGDFFRSRRGPSGGGGGPPTDPSTTEDSPDSVPHRKGRILFIGYADPPTVQRTVADLQAKFPRHTIEVFIPSEIIEMDKFQSPGLFRRRTRTFFQRCSLARWTLSRYDAIARYEIIPRYVFEMLFPFSVLLNEKGLINVHHNRRSDFFVTLILRPFVYVAAAVLTLAALLKPRPKVDYFTWDRKASTKTTP